MHFFSDIPNIIGLIGVTVLLVAYYLLQTNMLKSEQMSYSVLNLIGSSMILFSLFYHWNLPGVVIEVAWIIISLIGVVKSSPRAVSER